MAIVPILKIYSGSTLPKDNPPNRQSAAATKLNAISRHEFFLKLAEKLSSRTLEPTAIAVIPTNCMETIFFIAKILSNPHPAINIPETEQEKYFKGAEGGNSELELFFS